MINKILISFIIFSALFLSTARNYANGEEKESAVIGQTVCPVLGSPIDKNIFLDYKGKRVYFCCSSCKGVFNSDPELYMKKLKELNSSKKN